MSDSLQSQTPTKPRKQPSRHWLSPEAWKVASEIADQLNETEKPARFQIMMLVKRMGTDFIQEVLQQTLAVEAEGGMMLADGSRRRTPGGVFFYLAKGKMTSTVRFRQEKDASPKPRSAKPVETITWDERQPIVVSLLQEPGVATSVKAVLIGAPTHIQPQPGYIMLKVTPEDKSPTLPKGVPKVALTPTQYTVYVSAKQWKRVEAAASDPEDRLIIEGTCFYEERIAGMAFYAINVTSKALSSFR